jgi:hypothetical protein
VSREATDTGRALEEALAEKARLWAQLHDQRANERELEHLRSQVAQMESSLSWRSTKPLRVAKRYWGKLQRRLYQPN